MFLTYSYRYSQPNWYKTLLKHKRDINYQFNSFEIKLLLKRLLEK
jgi:hypothetical protein